MTITFSQLGKQGRLGNQLWQISATIAAAKRIYQPYAFPPWEYEQYFNLHGCFTTNIRVQRSYQEPHFHYSPIPNFVDVDLSGYYQSYRYFSDHDDFIRQMFEFKHPILTQRNTTSIHIRRGDYVVLGNDYYIELPYSYYEAAMSITNSERYMIFSDDINWCKSKFIDSKFIFSENRHPAVDLALMAACENNIISNSSFSWWAAYLNKNFNKKIIAPNVWFGYKMPHDTKDLLPREWVVL
jgi:hypothetical protein